MPTDGESRGMRVWECDVDTELDFVRTELERLLLVRFLHNRLSPDEQRRYDGRTRRERALLVARHS